MGYLLLLFRVSEEDGQFVGLCEELGVSSCGDTLADALAATFEAAILYLNTLEQLGDRERVFKEKKLHLSSLVPTKDVRPTVHPGEMVSPQRLVLTDC